MRPGGRAARKLEAAPAPAPAPEASGDPVDPVRVWLVSQVGHVEGARDVLRTYDQRRTQARATRAWIVEQLDRLVTLIAARLAVPLPPRVAR